jgi:hypothetical protein
MARRSLPLPAKPAAELLLGIVLARVSLGDRRAFCAGCGCEVDRTERVAPHVLDFGGETPALRLACDDCGRRAGGEHLMAHADPSHAGEIPAAHEIPPYRLVRRSDVESAELAAASMHSEVAFVVETVQVNEVAFVVESLHPNAAGA